MTPNMTNATGSTPAPSDQDGDAHVTLKICVERLSDGSFRVYKEPEAMATQDGMPAEEPEGEAVQTASDLEGALKLVMDIEADNADDNSDGAQFAAGFQSEKQEGY